MPAVEVAIRAQEAAGLEPVTDGRLAATSPFDVDADGWAAWQRSLTVDGWRAAAGLTERAVKQALPGPYSLTRALPRTAGAKARQRAALAAADGLRAEALALAAAGCPLVEIEEAEAHRIGADETERRLFAAAHRRLADGFEATHLSLSIVGGSAWEAGAATILDPPYASLAVDLVAGPDNWRLVAAAAGDRGIIAGALSPQLDGEDGPEILLWAANYAASTGGRGSARVGLGTAGGLGALRWEQAIVKLERLGHAVRIASMPAGEAQAAELDPRAVNARSAALGRAVPSRRLTGRPASARSWPRRTIPG